MFKQCVAAVVGVAAGCLGLPSGYATTCSPLIHYQRVVGDTAGDTNCTDNDIQSAIDNAVCPNTTIYITGEHLYKAQHLLIQDKSLSLVGTASATCNIGPGDNRPESGAPTAPIITISGAGHSGDSVVSIHGNSNVTLQYLEVADGASDTDQYGGGIYFGGKGSLTLDTDTIDNNFAGYGGGINMIGEGGDATLTLKNNALILSNRAQFNGGGIRIEGTSRLFMLTKGPTIAFNTAIGKNPDGSANEGNGGGLVVFGPSRADIASSSLTGAVSFNSAPYGGGIAAIATVDGVAVVRLFTVDAHEPVLIASNTASVLGGGIYTRSRTAGANHQTQNPAVLCATNFRFDNNVAPEGAAFYGDYEDSDSLGSELFLNPKGNCGPESIASLGAVACAAGEPCNEINGNVAQASDGTLTDGSIIYMEDYAGLGADRFSMRNNHASKMITLKMNSGTVGLISHCLVADNHTTHEVIHLEQVITPIIFNCTIANNTIDDGFVFFAKDGFNLSDSVVWQPGESTLDYVDDDECFCLLIQNIVASEISTLSGDGIVKADPLFVDPSNANIDSRNYSLKASVQNGFVTASPAIDASPVPNDDGVDFDGHTSDLDVPLVPDRNPGWWHDLGALEAQPITDRIFGDAFGDSLSLLEIDQ